MFRPILLGKFDEIAPDVENVYVLSEAHIKTYICAPVKPTDTSLVDPDVVKKALEGLIMSMTITNAEGRITHYCVDFFDRLECAGFGSFRGDNPEATIELLLQPVQQYALENHVRERIKFEKKLEKRVKLLSKCYTNKPRTFKSLASSNRKHILTETHMRVSGKDNNTSGKASKADKPNRRKRENPFCLREERRAKGI